MPPMPESAKRTADVTIRRVDPAAELDRLAPLWQALQAHHLSLGTVDWPARDPDGSWAVRRAHYSRAIEGGAELWLAEREGDIVGYGFVHGRAPSATWDVAAVATLDTLVIAPGERGNGIGERIVGAAADALRSEGVTHLSVGYIEGNDRAASFYERLGFRPLERVVAMPLR
jgi:GNAT superfamily N-acetyltransferase